MSYESFYKSTGTHTHQTSRTNELLPVMLEVADQGAAFSKTNFQIATDTTCIKWHGRSTLMKPSGRGTVDEGHSSIASKRR